MGNTSPSVKTVIVAYDAQRNPSPLAPNLTQLGYTVVATVSGHQDILHATQTFKPQILLLTLTGSLTEKFDTIHQILALRTTAIIVVLKEWDASLAKQAMDAGVAGYVIEPFEASHISATVESSWHHFQKLLALQDDLELRKLLEKAKGLLMKDQFMSEEEAHQAILRMSQDQSVPLKDLCHSIIHSKQSQGGIKK